MRTGRLVTLASALLAAFSLQAVSQIAILCTTTVVGDVVRQIAGDAVSVTVLLPIGADPHAFQASPQDAIAIEAANRIAATASVPHFVTRLRRASVTAGV